MLPNSKQYWQQLAATYLQLEESVRAINTIERAQQYGIMNSPKDNYNLVGIYFNIKQYDRAIDLLETGLKNGNIENEQRNWELLAACYQQLHKETKAIESLKEAAKRFPKSGALDFQIGSIFYSMDKTQDAYNFIKSSLEKGVDKPASAYVFLAYLAFELKKLDEALDAAQKAVKADPNSRDGQRLLEAIKDAIKDRENQKNQPL
jgi:tetratricopeptide (TPR) repeat protein